MLSCKPRKKLRESNEEDLALLWQDISSLSMWGERERGGRGELPRDHPSHRHIGLFPLWQGPLTLTIQIYHFEDFRESLSLLVKSMDPLWHFFSFH